MNSFSTLVNEVMAEHRRGQRVLASSMLILDLCFSFETLKL
jgi:hypothetical protein